VLVGSDGSDTLIDAFGDDFVQALLSDNATDHLFDSLGDDWFVLDSADSKTDLNPFDRDLVTQF
jgi:hypothetical protein